MVALLSEFEDRLPLSPAFIDLRGQERYDEALPMEWVLKVRGCSVKVPNGNGTDGCVRSIPCSIGTGGSLARKGNARFSL